MAAKRERWLDGLKGFCILLVILGHVLSGYLDAGTFPEAYYSFYQLRTWIYSFHMPLFFIISGYTFTLAYYGDGKLRKKGFARQMVNLLWLYVLFSLLQWSIKQMVPELVNEVYTVETLKNMFREPLGNFWYIYVLFIFYGVGALVQLPKWPKMWALLLGGIAIVCAQSHMDWTALTEYRVLYHFGFFFLGTVFCRNRGLLKNQKLFGCACMFLATCTLLYGYFWCRNWYGNWKYMIAVATSYVMIYQFYRFPRFSNLKLLQICGRHSLELYLLHTFFTAGLRSLLPKMGLTIPWVSVWLNFLVSTGLSLLIAWCAAKTWVMDAVFRPARFVERVAGQLQSTRKHE